MRSEGLQTLISKLKENRRNTVVFHGRTEMERVRFSDLYQAVSLVSRQLGEFGLMAGMQVAVIAENGKAAFLLDLALLDIGCIALQVPEKTAGSALVDIGQQNIAFLLVSALFLDEVDTGSWEPIGTLQGLRLFRNPACSNAFAPVAGPIIFFVRDERQTEEDSCQ